MEAFNFRIIKSANGVEIIDSTLSTPYNSLTPMQMIDYINVEDMLYLAEKQNKAKVEEVKDNFLYKIKLTIKRMERRLFAWKVTTHQTLIWDIFHQ